MALINPSSLYSGGNVRLDPTPYVNIALRQRAMKEARAQALDQYYQKLPDTINDKGVRDNEVGEIANYKNKLAQTWMENRDAIRKGDPSAILKMQQLYRDAGSVVRKSQDAAKTDIEIGRLLYSHPENQEMLNSADYLVAHEKSQYPVNDPRYQPLDIGSIMANRPFSQDEYVKQIKSNFKYGEGVPTIAPSPTDKNLEIVTSNPQLDDGTKEKIYDFSSYKLHNNTAFKKQLEKDFSTPEQLQRLNDVSVKVFGHEISKPEDIAAAYTVSLLPTTTTRQTVRTSIDAQNSEWDRRNRITNAQRVRAAELSSHRKDARVKAMMNYGIDDPYDKATSKPITINTPVGETVDLYDITDMSPTEKEDLLGKGSDGAEYQNYPIEINGKLYLKKGKNGELLNDNGEPIDREQPFINRVKRVGRVTKLQTKGELNRGSKKAGKLDNL